MTVAEMLEAIREDIDAWSDNLPTQPVQADFDAAIADIDSVGPTTGPTTQIIANLRAQLAALKEKLKNQDTITQADLDALTALADAISNAEEEQSGGQMGGG